MQSNMLNDTLVSLDAAWLCAAERDIDREEEDRIALLARNKMRGVKGKYELDTAAQLDKDLKQQQLEHRKRAVKREKQQQQQQQLQLPVLSVTHASSSSSQPLPPHSPQEHQRNHTKNETKKTRIYELENQRLVSLMTNKPAATKRNQLPTVLSKNNKRKPQPRIVDDMLAFERRYAVSACRIQTWWRSHLHKWFWKTYFNKVRAVTQIQRIVRGFVCRCIVRSWHSNRTHRATRIQAAVRGYFMRKVVQPWKQWESVNVVRIQSIVRGHFGRRTARERRSWIAVLHVQSLWRGYRSRRRTNLMWLSKKAVELQRFVRGLQARKRARRRRHLNTQAATQIQRIFRGTLARAVVDTMLRDRETANRKEWMRVLEAEESWHRQQRDRLQSRLERLHIHEQLCQLEDQYHKAHERVNDLESIYLDMQTQRLRVSPRAIEHGWVEEMEQKMRTQRQLITAAKLQVVFEMGPAFKRKEEDYLAMKERIRLLEDKRRRFEVARDEEFLDYWERECKFAHEQKTLERKRRIAETRRRWRVQFYHPNGKRDKRWRGTHWTEDVLEDAKKRQVLCVGSTNLLADIQAKWRHHLERVSPNPVEQNEEEITRQRLCELEEQVALVTANTQTQQTIAIFDPVFRDIEARFDQVKSHQQRNETKSKLLKAARVAAAESQAEEQSKKKDTDLVRPLVGTKSDSAERHLKIRRAMQASRIPWHLLDQLAAERRKLAEEKTVYKVWQRVPDSMLMKKA